MSQLIYIKYTKKSSVTSICDIQRVMFVTKYVLSVINVKQLSVTSVYDTKYVVSVTHKKNVRLCPKFRDEYLIKSNVVCKYIIFCC